MDGGESVKNSKKKEVRRHSRQRSEDKTSTKKTCNLVFSPKRCRRISGLDGDQKAARGDCRKTFKIANLWLTHIFNFRFKPKVVLDARMAIPGAFSARYAREESVASGHVYANLRILRF